MVAGAVAMVASGLVPPSQAGRQLLDSWNILLFFTGLILIAWSAEQSGFFRWIALTAAHLARGDSRRLLLNVFAVGILTSTFLSNDATALLLTPVVIAIAEETALSPIPLALACTFIADTASVSLPVSNPINVLFLESFHGIHLGAYLGHLLAPSLAAIVINVLLFVLLFRATDSARFEGAHLPSPGTAILAEGYFRYCVGCLGLIAVAYLVVSLEGGPLSLVAIAGAAALLGGGIVSRSLSIERLRGVPWAIIPFVAGLLVLVRGLENAGVTTWLGAEVVAIADRGRLIGVFATVFGGALAANGLNNLPAATVLAASIRHANVYPLAARRDLVYAAIFGCDIGPNLTILGSLSTTLWLLLLRRRGLHVTSWQYLRTGLVVTTPMLLAGAALLAVLH